MGERDVGGGDQRQGLPRRQHGGADVGGDLFHQRRRHRGICNEHGRRNRRIDHDLAETVLRPLFHREGDEEAFAFTVQIGNRRDDARISRRPLAFAHEDQIARNKQPPS